MQEVQGQGSRQKRFNGLLTGGWKRWLFMGPLALALLLTLVYFLQPVLAYAWRFMPVFVFMSACAAGLCFTRLSRKGKIWLAVGAAVTSGLLVWNAGPAVTTVLVLSLLSAILLGARPASNALNVTAKGSAFLMGLWLLLVNLVPAFTEYQLASHIVGNMEQLEKFPVTINDRNLPRTTGLEYSSRANEDRTKEVQRVHIVWLPAGTPSTLESQDGSLKPLQRERTVWQAPLRYSPEITANKFWHSFWGSVSGVIRMDGTDMKMRADVESGKDAYFMFGAYSWVTETIFRVRHPFSAPAERVYWQKADGTWCMLISRVTYKPTWTGTMIPVMDGVMELGSYGGFKDHTPEQASELFRGAALYPPQLARTYGEAYSKFRLGLLDYFWNQEGLLEISEEATDSHVFPNEQPYFQNIEGMGPQLLMPLEPKGQKANALSQVLIFDAVSGKLRMFRRTGGAIVNGPRTALENVHEAAPELDWKLYEKVEPLIIHTVDDRWYYQVSVINNSRGQATVRIIVVDAVTLTPVAFQRVEDVHRYVETGELPRGRRAVQGNDSGGQVVDIPDSDKED